MSGRMIGDDPGHHRLDPGDQRRLAQPSVRKGGVVGDIDDVDVRPQPPDLGEHGQAAEARIEYERAARPAPGPILFRIVRHLASRPLVPERA